MPKPCSLPPGGAGRIYASSTDAFMNTGDGLGIAPAPAFRWKTWNSGSFTPPAWPVPVC